MATVLLLEDDADCAAPIAIILRRRSHQVKIASDGEQALSLLLGGFKPDVVITDLHMPVMDGITFLDNFRSFREFHNTPVVVVSAMSQLAENELRPYRVSALLTKGRVDLVAMADSIDELDRLRQGTQQSFSEIPDVLSVALV